MSSVTNVRANEAGGSDSSASIGKKAEEVSEDELSKNRKEVPGETDSDQRLITYSEVRQEKKEAQRDPSKKVQDGQIEL
jgi:hypothetical protein